MMDGNTVMMSTPNGLLDKSKELQKEILMEKLRSKTSQYKNLAETSKGVRMTMLVRFVTCSKQAFFIILALFFQVRDCYLFRTSVGPLIAKTA